MDVKWFPACFDDYSAFAAAPVATSMLFPPALLPLSPDGMTGRSNAASRKVACSARRQNVTWAPGPVRGAQRLLRVVEARKTVRKSNVATACPR